MLSRLNQTVCKKTYLCAKLAVPKTRAACSIRVGGLYGEAGRGVMPFTFSGVENGRYYSTVGGKNALQDDSAFSVLSEEGTVASGSFMESMYEAWTQDAASVDPSWRAFFEGEVQNYAQHSNASSKKGMPAGSGASTGGPLLEQGAVRTAILNHLKVQLLVNSFLIFVFNFCIEYSQSS